MAPAYLFKKLRRIITAFKALFLAHAPDADKAKHRILIDTGVYRLFSIVVKNQEEVIEVCKDFIQNKKIDSILLCPGFIPIQMLLKFLKLLEVAWLFLYPEEMDQAVGFR